MCGMVRADTWFSLRHRGAYAILVLSDFCQKEVMDMAIFAGVIAIVVVAVVVVVAAVAAIVAGVKDTLDDDA